MEGWRDGREEVLVIALEVYSILRLTPPSLPPSLPPSPSLRFPSSRASWTYTPSWPSRLSSPAPSWAVPSRRSLRS